jgi:hypothetical protein
VVLLDLLAAAISTEAKLANVSFDAACRGARTFLTQAEPPLLTRTGRRPDESARWRNVYNPSATSAQRSTVLPFRKSTTPGSIIAGRLRPIAFAGHSCISHSEKGYSRALYVMGRAL